MIEIFKESFYIGISGLDFEEDSFDFGDDIKIRKTYAHLMSPFVMAFQPAKLGEHHPAPWKSARGGNSFDIGAELLIPDSIEAKYTSKMKVAEIIGFLFRLGINPATRLSVISNHSFISLSNMPDSESIIYPFEVQPRYFALSIASGNATYDSLDWVSKRWRTVHRLTVENKNFAMAISAIDTGQFIQNSALTMVLLWGALEALFSPSKGELKFRVSSLIAAYLSPPGEDRLKHQKEIAKLYDKRSYAAHGKPKHNPDDLLATFHLLRSVIIKIIDNKQVPSKNDLEKLLFGMDLHYGE